MALANQRLCYPLPFPNLLCPFSRRLFEQQCLGCHLLSHLNPSMLLYILYIRYCYNGEFAALAFAWSVSIASCVCVTCVVASGLWLRSPRGGGSRGNEKTRILNPFEHHFVCVHDLLLMSFAKESTLRSRVHPVHTRWCQLTLVD